MFNDLESTKSNNRHLHYISPNVWVSIRKVGRARATDESTVRIRVCMLVTDLCLLLLLETTATLDLANLKFDSGSIKPE